MTAAVIQATYADWKLVKTRATVQLVFEIDASQADLAYKVLGGMPQTGGQVDVAIARLNSPTDNKATAVGQVAGGGATEIPRAKPEKTPAQKAAIRAVLLCKEPAFQKWLGAANEADAAVDLRYRLKALSRRDIAADPDVFDLWSKLVDEYDLHQRYGDRR